MSHHQQDSSWLAGKQGSWNLGVGGNVSKGKLICNSSHGQLQCKVQLDQHNWAEFVQRGRVAKRMAPGREKKTPHHNGMSWWCWWWAKGQTRLSCCAWNVTDTKKERKNGVWSASQLAFGFLQSLSYSVCVPSCSLTTLNFSLFFLRLWIAESGDRTTHHSLFLFPAPASLPSSVRTVTPSPRTINCSNCHNRFSFRKIN